MGGSITAKRRKRSAHGCGEWFWASVVAASLCCQRLPSLGDRRRGTLGGLVTLRSSYSLEAASASSTTSAMVGPAPKRSPNAYISTHLESRNTSRLTTRTSIWIRRNVASGDTKIVIIDSLVDDIAVMEELFAFRSFARFSRTGFGCSFDAMNAVTGPYAQHILEQRWALLQERNQWHALVDFGGLHPIRICACRGIG